MLPGKCRSETAVRPAMACKQCASGNQSVFNAEIAIHFPGLEGLNKAIVWVFTKPLVCLHCGFAESSPFSPRMTFGPLFAAASSRDNCAESKPPSPHLISSRMARQKSGTTSHGCWASSSQHFTDRLDRPQLSLRARKCDMGYRA